MKIPKIGDKIEHTLSHLNKKRKGKVTLILDSQFVYEYGKNKHTGFCMFRDDIWSYDK
tara:strand:+ start:21 stop:194 length:174 start_codon:yes stop_codon:yes gene_type:complete